MSEREEPPPRYAPERALPAYAYVPGRRPHPLRDPQGHGMGALDEHTAPFDARAWRESPAYCYGVDLFNHGYFWEAHEAWETLWRHCPRNSADARFLKGLIALAAAGVKAHQGRPRGVRRHAARARALFAALGRERCAHAGLVPHELVRALTRAGDVRAWRLCPGGRPSVREAPSSM